MHAPIDTNDTYICFEKHIPFVHSRSNSILKENPFFYNLNFKVTSYFNYEIVAIKFWTKHVLTTIGFKMILVCFYLK